MSNINLDDSDDDLDLPPPPQNNGNQHKDPISLDSDGDDDDLPPPSNNNLDAADSIVVPSPTGGNNKPAVSLDDSDDDLPPPNKGGAPAPASSPPSSPAGAANNNTPAPKPAAKQQAALPPAGSSSANMGAGVDRQRTGTIMNNNRRKISDASMEASLFKQSPTWPYVMQKRWVTLKGRLLSYYEEKSSQTPSGTLDLKGAQIVDSPSNAKAPHAFGITGDTPSLKGRTFIFAASSREEYLGWLDILKFVTTEPRNSEIHWFEKMAQGLF